MPESFGVDIDVRAIGELVAPARDRFGLRGPGMVERQRLVEKSSTSLKLSCTADTPG